MESAPIEEKNIDPTIRVKRVCAWQVDWLAGLLNIPKKKVVEVVMDGLVDSHKADLTERTRRFLNRPTLDD